MPRAELRAVLSGRPCSVVTSTSARQPDVPHGVHALGAVLLVPHGLCAPHGHQE